MIYIDAIDGNYVPSVTEAFESGSAGQGGGRGGERGGMSPMGGALGGSNDKGFLLIIHGHTPYGGADPATAQGQAVIFLADWAKKLKSIRGKDAQFYVSKVDENPQALPMTTTGMASNAGIVPLWMPPVASLASRTQKPTLTVGSGMVAASTPGRGGYGGGRGYDDRGGRGGGRGYDDRGGRGGGRGYDDRGGGRGYDDRGGYSPAASTYNTGPSSDLHLDPLTGEPMGSDFSFTIRVAVTMGQAPDAPPETPVP